MDGELKYIHVAWIPAIPAGMTGFVTLMYNDESASLGTRFWKLQLPVSRSWSFARGVPNQEIGNPHKHPKQETGLTLHPLRILSVGINNYLPELIKIHKIQLEEHILCPVTEKMKVSF